MCSVLPPCQRGHEWKLASLDVITVCELTLWVRLQARLFIMWASEWAPPRLFPPTRWAALSCSLMEWRVWRAVIRSVLHHPAGQNGRDDMGDLWIIYQHWRLSHRIKNVALAQTTFSHQHVLITQCHKDPPPLLSYLTALMSGHAIKYEPKNCNLAWLQMPCSSHQLLSDLISLILLRLKVAMYKLQVPREELFCSSSCPNKSRSYIK